MSAMPAPTDPAPAGSRKLCIASLTSLTTIANDCMSDSESDAHTVTANGTVRKASSPRPEPPEADAEAHRDEAGESGEADIQRVLGSLGFEGCPLGGALLPAPASSTPPTSGAAPRHRNLFWRRYHAARKLPGKMTASQLAAHDAAAHSTAGAGRLAPAPSAGEWLRQFKTKALGVPVADISARILGPELGTEVAALLGAHGLGTPSELHGGSAQPGDAPDDGHRVVGSKCRRVPACTAHGRAAFLLDDEVSVSTPGPASPHPSDTGSEASGEDDRAGQGLPEAWAEEQIAKMAFGGGL